MAHLQYIPGDPRLVDQLVYELKSKGIFDQFRKDCIADVDTRPAYQNLRQRVETSVSTFLSRQCWKPDLNKNQLREKLRKHILDGNYLEQGVERIVDQVVNPKVASVFIPQVEDLVYNYLGIARKKSAQVAETSNGKLPENDLLPTDLEAVSPGSVKSHDDKNEDMDVDANVEETKMEVDKPNVKDEIDTDKVKADPQDTQLSGLSDLTSNDSNSFDKIQIPLPSDEIKPEDIPAPESSPPKAEKLKVELEKIQLPLEPNPSIDIPLPVGIPKSEKESYYKTEINSDDDDSSSDSSLIRNMSPLTPIRNFNNENSCDAQQAFENNSEDNKSEKKETIEPSTFRFTIEAKDAEASSDAVKTEKKETENLSYQFDNQVNINTFNTPLYDESSSSNHLHIDYESDVNSKTNTENKVPEPDHNSEDSRKDRKSDEKKSSHKSSHHRDSHRHSSSRDRRSDSKQSSSKDNKSERKSSKDEHKSSSKSSSHREKPSEKSDKKDSRDSSKHRSSSSHKSSSSHRDSKSHRSSSSSQRHSSSSKNTDEKKSSSSTHKDRSDKSSDKYSKEKSSKDSKSSSSHRSDKDRKSSSSSKRKSEDKDRKKEKKETDDHYSASGRGNNTRRSTDRDSNDGNSSSSKGSHNQPSSKSSETKKDSKGSTSKSDNTSTSGDSPSPSDKDLKVNEMGRKIQGVLQVKPIVRIENHLETPIISPPRLPFVPDVTLKKPKFAANMQEAKKLIKMRKFLEDEQKRMNQEAALLLEFQANVRPSMSQVYSSIPGPELEFACVKSSSRDIVADTQAHSGSASPENGLADNDKNDSIDDILSAAEQVDNKVVKDVPDKQSVTIEDAVDNSATIATAEGELENEVDGNSQEATVQIENIIGANIADTCEMEVDTPIDGKNIQILDNGPNVIVENIEMLPEVKKIEPPKKEEKVQVQTIENLNDETLHLSSVEPDDGIEERLRLMEDDDKPTEYFQVTVITEELSETDDITQSIPEESVQSEETLCPDENPLSYFAENEKYNAELERATFSNFLKSFTEKVETNKMYLINCATYEENILKEASEDFGNFEIVNYYKNGHFKLKTPKNIVRNINVDSEITLPTNVNGERKSPDLLFSPVKSECSFELSSDYDAKLEEMVNKTSRKEIMEIILGSVVDECASEPSEMPTIDYCTESNIESDTENSVKRKYCEVGSSLNNNRQVLTPNKIRKLSGSDQISSTTEESEETSNNNVVSNPVRSKYLGRAKRVGLPRPKRSNLLNSPSSDKSVENYAENVQTTQPNGKLKGPRKVQRYDTSDLYKPKLHYLSRRNNIS